MKKTIIYIYIKSENQDTNFSSKLDKVYRWYIINKRATPKEKQVKNFASKD